MDKTTASQKFQQSVRLFSQKRYVEALILLDELNAAFPKQKQVLYGRAQCLAELQRHAEAIAVCDQAIEWFDDANAKKLKARIQRDNFHTIEGPTDLATLLGASAPPAGGGTGLPNLSGLLDLPPMPKPAAAGYRPARSSRRRFYTLLACAAGLLVVLALGFPVLASMRQEEKSAAQPAALAAAGDAGAAAEPQAAPAEPRGCERPETIGGSGTAETIGEGEDTMTLLRIQGNRYELGYWYGKLLADQIAETWKLVQAMAEREGIPMQMVDAAAATLWQEKNFDMGPWSTEVQGIADGCADAGHPELTFSVLKRIAAIPDLSEYNCSLFVAWGAATLNGETYQMRNLDWSMDTGFQNYPVVAVYSPEDGVKHAVVGFAGVIGVSVGGMNVEGLAVSEIMGHFCDQETLEGIPFPFLLRDVLYFDTDLQSALARMKSATRTNQYHYALADPDAPDPKGRLLFTSNTRFDEYTDNQSVKPHPCADVKPFHESMDDVVYWKNHNGRDNDVLYDAILERYGQIDAEKAIEIAKAACVDGTLVSIIYHNSGNDMWVAFAEGLTPGPRQTYVHVKLDD